MRIAYIGLGALGAPIAMNLLRAGHELAVTDLNRATPRRVRTSPSRASPRPGRSRPWSWASAA
jgi:3-hydroxyisobutyrate dehydrogenase-like beta-hydroxyacid dehydrogenase